MPTRDEQLALFGGPRTCNVEPRETFPVPTREISEAVAALIDGDVYSTTDDEPYRNFEREWAEYCNAEYCLAQNNGTSTLWSALWACGVGPGDEVISSTYTWISSYAPVWQLGARVVFAEMDPHSLLIDPADVERRITPRTKTIIVVHLYGHVADMSAINAIARKHGLRVIEDCSHAHGAEYRGRKVGTLGDIGCFSMQGSPWGGKALPAGEGGVLVTDDSELYRRCLFYGHLNRNGMAEEISGTEFAPFRNYASGLKFRAHPWALAVARVCLKSLDERNALRSAYVRRICAGIRDLPGICPRAQPQGGKPAGYYGGMHLIYQPDELDGLSAERFVAALNAEGVDMSHRDYTLFHLTAHMTQGLDVTNSGEGPLSGPHFVPAVPGSLPVSEEAHGRVLGMPTFIRENPGYSDGVIAAFRKVTANHKQLLALAATQ